MLFLFFSPVLIKCWKFATYDELQIQCSICKRIQKNFDDFEPLIPDKDSFCSSNKSNKMCNYIEQLAEQYTKSKNKTAFCHNANVCPDKIPDGYIGSRCKICIFLVKHLLYHDYEDRKKAFYHFCTTSQVAPGNFCGDIIDDGLDDFLEDIEDIKEPLNLCHTSHFCRSDPNGSKNQDDQDEL